VSLYLSVTLATIIIAALSLHDALPIYSRCCRGNLQFWESIRTGRRSCRWRPRRCARQRDLGQTGHGHDLTGEGNQEAGAGGNLEDRKSTRLNSSHVSISYDVICL